MTTPANLVPSIEDNYDDYFIESAGWCYDAWDRFSPEDLSAYDQVKRSSNEDLLTWSPEVPWHLWFKVQVLIGKGLYEQALVTGLTLLPDVTADASPLIHVEDMARVLLDVAMRHARDHVASISKVWGEKKLDAITDVEGCLSWALDGSTDKLERWVATQPDASEAYMDIAQLMWRWEHPEDAAQWATRAFEHSAPHAPVRIDIELLQARLQQLDKEPHM